MQNLSQKVKPVCNDWKIAELFNFVHTNNRKSDSGTSLKFITIYITIISITFLSFTTIDFNKTVTLKGSGRGVSFVRYFFAQALCIKLDSPQAAQLSIS